MSITERLQKSLALTQALEDRLTSLGCDLKNQSGEHFLQVRLNHWVAITVDKGPDPDGIPLYVHAVIPAKAVGSTVAHMLTYKPISPLGD